METEELPRDAALPGVLERILTKARRFTRAEAGSIYVREGNALRFAAVQNDPLMKRFGEQEVRRRLLQAPPLEMSEHSLAGYVGITGRTLNVHDAYRISPERTYRFDRTFDERNNYRTVSVLLIPIHDSSKSVLGVLQLINALDAHGRPVPFQPPYAYVQRSLASYAALAIQGARADRARPGAERQGTSADPLPGVVRGPEAQNGGAALVPSTADLRSATLAGRRLGELLTAQRLITHEQLGTALAEQNRTQEKLGTILVRTGAISEEQLVEFLGRQYRVPVLTVPDTPSPELLRLVPTEVAKRYEVLPVQRTGNLLTVAMADPTNLAAIDDVAFLTSLHVVPGIAPPSQLRKAIEASYRTATTTLDDVVSEAEGELPEIEIIEANEGEPALDLVELRSSSDQAPVVRIVNMLLLDAIRRRASDIHLEPFRESFRVRFRIDGVLQQVMTPPKRLAAAITSRIKIMADLDIAERRRAQDGRIRLRSANVEADIRVATLPTVFGESVILRVLDRGTATLDLAQLGFEAEGFERVRAALRAQHGLILVTGPTGSGKTTTLYAALQSLNSLGVKIVTIEDPVEYQIEGINQVQVSEESGRTFPSALRSFLRSDPDVIMLGEMRDAETVQTAVRAALTGHLVLSTLHTNDSASTVARLLDMGVPAFLASAALRLVVGQRLIRTICPDCREPHEVTEESLIAQGHRPTGRATHSLFRGKGCPPCNFTGMRGRVAIYEILPMTPMLRDLLGKGPSIDEIRRAASEHGTATLREAGLRKVLEGLTTLEEVVRVTSD